MEGSSSLPKLSKKEDHSFVHPTPMDTSSHTDSDSWTLFGKKTKQSKVVFFSQIIGIYLVIIVSLINISLITGGLVPDNSMLNLWHIAS